MRPDGPFEELRRRMRLNDPNRIVDIASAQLHEVLSPPLWQTYPDKKDRWSAVIRSAYLLGFIKGLVTAWCMMLSVEAKKRDRALKGTLDRLGFPKRLQGAFRELVGTPAYVAGMGDGHEFARSGTPGGEESQTRIVDQLWREITGSPEVRSEPKPASDELKQALAELDEKAARVRAIYERWERQEP